MRALFRGLAIIAGLTAFFLVADADAAPAKRKRKHHAPAVAAAAATPPAPPIAPTPEPEPPPSMITEPTKTEPAPAAPPPPPPPPPPIDLAPPEKRVELGGRIFTYLRAPITDVHDPLEQLSSTLWIDAHARVSKGAFAAFSVVGDLMSPSASGTTDVRGRIREAYAGVHDSGIEARIGHQILAWGNADGLHTVDFLTAHDYAFYSIDGDARQIGAPSVLLSYKGDDGASPLELTAVWQPVAPVSTVLIPKNALPPNVQVLDEDKPRYSPTDSELAAKIGISPGGWDIALIGFHGQNHLAEPYLAGPPANGVVQIGRAHHELNAIGLQASISLDSWVLRFEGAYVLTENPDGRNRLIEPSYIDAIAGLEHPFGERLRIGVQGILRAYPHYPPLQAPYPKVAPDAAFVDRQIAEVNSRLFNYTNQVRPGASLGTAFTSEDESFELSIAGLAYFVGFDWALQPMITYRAFEAFKLDFGAQIFGGHKNSLGFLSTQSGVFAQATYTF